MNNRKLRFTVLSILVLVIISLVAFTGCKNKEDDGGDGSTDSSSSVISIEKSKQPRLIYVEGQDLDLSKGFISVTENGEKKYIPLNDSRVTVTGYNKHVLGNQTLTVSYNGQTTTYKIAVMARMTVENFETDYFVGEKFNKNKGKIKFTSDAGVTSTLDMKNDSITVKSFNSSVAGSVNVTIQYNGYDCTFPVTIHAPDPAKVQFKQPTKLDYFSHESLNFSGSYLTVTASSPSNLKKTLYITDDMVSGYNPEAVTEANENTPVKQTVTVAYAGLSWTFDVNVLYSPIYTIESLASKLGDVDSYLALEEGENITAITLPAGAGEAAKKGIQSYFKLSESDKNLIDYSTILDFARVAAFYVNVHDYVGAVDGLANAFVLSPDGLLSYVGSSYEVVVNAIAILENSESDYNKFAALLDSIREEFGEEDFNSTYKISQLTTPHTDDDVEMIISKLQHIINVYDMLKDMPDNWEAMIKTNPTDFTTTYGKKITDTVFIISSSDYRRDKGFTEATAMYAVITRWRADFFDIIYSYYYYVKEGGKDQVFSDLWGKVPAPGLIEDFYAAYETTYNIGYQLTEQKKTSPGSVIGTDLSPYHYYYRMALNYANRIKSGDNELYKVIYNTLNLDAYFNVYLNAPSTSLLGYYDFVGPVLDNEKVADALDKYLVLIDCYLKNGQKIPSPIDNRVQYLAFFNAMGELSPTELHWFLSTISLDYHNTNGVLRILDYNTSKYYIASFLYIFFLNELPHGDQPNYLYPAQAAFANFLMAMEIYPTSQYNYEAMTTFKSLMKTAIEQVNKIETEEDRQKFYDILGNTWTKYVDIYKSVQNPSFTLSEDEEAKFDELYQLLEEFNNIRNDTENVSPMRYPYLLAIYAKATAIYEELHASTDADISIALLSKLYTLTVEDGKDADNNIVYRTFEYSIESYYYFVKYMIYDTMIPVGHLDYYNDLNEVILNLYPMFAAEFNGTVYTGTDVDELIATVRAFDNEDRLAFYSLQADTIFYAAINRYIEANKDQTTLNNGAAEEKINELVALIKDFYTVYKTVTNENSTEAYPLLTAIAIKSSSLYNEIMSIANGNPDIINALNYKLYSITVGEDTINATIDELYLFMSYTVYDLIDGADSLYVAVCDAEVRELLVKMIPLLMAEYLDTLYDGDAILALLAELRALDSESKYNFYVINGNIGFYAAFERYLNTQISEAAQSSKIVSYLFNAEIYYSLYELNNNDKTSLNTFKTAMENARDVYASLSDEDKAILAILRYDELYKIYLDHFGKTIVIG